MQEVVTQPGALLQHWRLRQCYCLLSLTPSDAATSVLVAAAVVAAAGEAYVWADDRMVPDTYVHHNVLHGNNTELSTVCKLDSHLSFACSLWCVPQRASFFGSCEAYSLHHDTDTHGPETECTAEWTAVEIPEDFLAYHQCTSHHRDPDQVCPSYEDVPLSWSKPCTSQNPEKTNERC